MIKKYLTFLQKNNYSNNTINTYKSILQIHIDDFDDIRNLKSSIRKYFNSPNTTWTHYNVICSYLEWNNDKRLKEFKELKLPRIPMKYMNVFKKNYLLNRTQILENDSQELQNKKLVIKFLFETGLRAIELLNIISFDHKTLLVNGKGNKIRQVFHNYQTTSLIHNLKITTKTLRQWVKDILGKQFTPHSIRRSHATHMLLNGANPKMVMMQLGHSKVETTFRYLHLSIEQNKKIYDKYY